MLKNKTVLVIGANGLLGDAVSKALLKKADNLILIDLDITELKSRYPSCVCQQLDITEESQVSEFFLNETSIDGVVNCSYPRNDHYGSHFYDVSVNSFNDNVGLHLGSSFLLMQKAAEYFQRKKKPLSFVNIASIYGVVAPDFSIYDNTKMTMPVEYAAIKSAIIHLTKYVVKYVNDSRFRVNCVSPGGIFDSQPTEFLESYKRKTNGKGMLIPSDIVDTIAFLLSEYSASITGQNIIVDDGFSL